MENVLKDIENLLSECDNQINDQIIGINYLEKLKYLLIDKLKLISIKNIKQPFTEEIINKHRENDLFIKIAKIKDKTTKFKYNVQNDNLCIILQGLKNLEIFEDLQLNKFYSTNLYPNTGLVLAKDTIISETISKDTLLLEIVNIRNNVSVEN